MVANELMNMDEVPRSTNKMVIGRNILAAQECRIAPVDVRRVILLLSLGEGWVRASVLSMGQIFTNYQ